MNQDTLPQSSQYFPWPLFRLLAISIALGFLMFHIPAWRKLPERFIYHSIIHLPWIFVPAILLFCISETLAFAYTRASVAAIASLLRLIFWFNDLSYRAIRRLLLTTFNIQDTYALVSLSFISEFALFAAFVTLLAHTIR